jgi:hypothetical protein
MYLPSGPLGPVEIDHFRHFGYVRVEGCFDLAAGSIARRWVDHHWERSGYDPADPATWTEGKIHWPNANHAPIAEVAPKALAAIHQLCGGAERIPATPSWGDAFIANYHFGADKPWVPSGPQAGGWHKDGDFFVHFLDSPEQGLLTIVLWSDVQHQGGPTYIAADSVSRIARYLAEHPEGLWNPGSEEYLAECAAGRAPVTMDFQSIIEDCSDFREATGRAGDVYLLHPYMLHCSSQNLLRQARLITNPPISFREPMCFDRPDGAYSAVEQTVLDGLGVARLDWRIRGERRRVTPPRLARQRQLQQEIAARLAR